MHRKEIEEAKIELKQLLLEKKKSYARYVADVHKPNVSMFKAKELENLKEALKHPVKESFKFSPGTSLPSLTKGVRDRRPFGNFSKF